MADQFLQFSTSIDRLTQKEAAWIDEHLGTIEAWNADEIEEGSERHGRFTELIGVYGFEDEDDTLGFEWNLEESEHRGKFLRIHASAQGDPDHVVAFVQEFLRAHRPKDAFAFSWAITCSPPRVGGFAGGAAFVTATGFEHVNTWSWCNQKRREKAGKK